MAHSNGAILLATLHLLGEPVTKDEFFKVISSALKLPLSIVKSTMTVNLREGVKWGYIKEACDKYSLHTVDLDEICQQNPEQQLTLSDVRNIPKREFKLPQKEMK